MTERVGLIGSDKPLIDVYDLGLVDLDGVAYAGHLPIAYAADSLNGARAAGMRLVFVTNNASREPQTVADQLTGLDIPTTADEIMTSAQAAAALLMTRLKPGDRVLVIGGAGLFTAVREVGLEIVTSADDHPVAVVQGFDPTLGWKDLAEAAYAVNGGAWYVASNRDLSIPRARGTAPGNGSLVNAVVAATGVQPVSAGKPEPTMYDMAVQRSGAGRALVIGDRLDTDLAGARSGGYDGLHVLTGVNSARDAVLAPDYLRPHYIAADLRGLSQTHPAPQRREEGWWDVRGAVARVTDQHLELSGTSEDPLDVVRASASAVWDYVDDGGTINPDSVPEFDIKES